MLLLESLSSVLGTVITPIFLFLSSVAVMSEVNILKILNPRNIIRDLTDLPKTTGTSPLRALTVALAGTLGVGNITGVASALICGGPGAIFWMWIGAIVVLGVKYAEVYLAVLFRQMNGNKYFGGAMYYIKYGLADKYGTKKSAVFGGIFAVLCCLNSLITGNIVQSNAASCIFPEEYRIYCGVFLAVCVLISIVYGAKKVERITSSIIPLLTAVYILLSLNIIINNIRYLPKILSIIFTSAFSGKAVIGGVAGFSFREAVRFGVMRGIFSNEAGCGTSPIAHAAADTKSPHHQACYGIFEVVFDTIILCTMTAFVLLIAGEKYGIIPWRSSEDVSPVTLSAFGLLGGEMTYGLLSLCIVLFAFATIIAQIYYGVISIGYISAKKTPQIIYYILSVGCAIIGSVISSPVMWLTADLIIGIMTAVNCIVIILLRSRLKEPHPRLFPH